MSISLVQPAIRGGIIPSLRNKNKVCRALNVSAQATAFQFLLFPLSFGKFHPDDLQPSKTERRPAFWTENNRILDYIDWFG